MTIPLGMFMGFWMYVWRKGQITEATVIGVFGLLLALWAGEPISRSDSWFAGLFHLSRDADRDRARGLRLRRIDAAGVAAAVAARLSQLVHEDRHDLPARARRHHRQSRAEDAGAHEFAAAAGRSSRDRCSRSASSPSRVAPSRASTR